MAVSKKAKALYMGFFDGIETFAANTITRYQETRHVKGLSPKEPVPEEYAKAYVAYWKQFGIHADPMWGWFYAARNGIMDVRYVPHTLYFTKIDQHYNARKLGYGFNDKNYYSRIFAPIRQPETVLRIFGKGFFTDAEYRQVDIDGAMRLLLENEEVICKPAQESGGGRSIEFWKPKQDQESIRRFLEDPGDTFIVQKIIKQHADLEKIHAGSINSLRICSILMEDGVHILSTTLRMGVNKARIDNLCAGGISVGVNEDGTMKEFAYNTFTCEKFAVHPQGFVFKGAQVPSYQKAVELVKRAHPMICHFRLVSWDIAIAEDGEPMLIEANMRKGGIKVNQFTNGPMFGDLTEKVIRETLGRKG